MTVQYQSHYSPISDAFQTQVARRRTMSRQSQRASSGQRASTVTGLLQGRASWMCPSTCSEWFLAEMHTTPQQLPPHATTRYLMICPPQPHHTSTNCPPPQRTSINCSQQHSVFSLCSLFTSVYPHLNDVHHQQQGFLGNKPLGTVARHAAGQHLCLPVHIIGSVQLWQHSKVSTIRSAQ